MEAQQSDGPENTLRIESSHWVAVTVPGRNRASLEVSATHTFLCKTDGLSCPSGTPELPLGVSFLSLKQASFLVAQLLKNLPAKWETWVPSLGWEDPLEKGKATHSSILAWGIPWTV